MNRVQPKPDDLPEEFYEALGRLESDRQVLAKGSWHEAHEDEDMLDLLQEWNEWELRHRKT